MRRGGVGVFLSIERSAPPLLGSEIAGGDSQSCDKGLNVRIIYCQGRPEELQPAYSLTPLPATPQAAQLAARARGIVSSPAGFKAGLEWKSQGHRAD